MKNIIVIIGAFILFLIPKYNIQGSDLEISLYEINFILIVWLILLLFEGLLQDVGLYKRGLNNELKPFYNKIILFKGWEANFFFLFGLLTSIIFFYSSVKDIILGLNSVEANIKMLIASPIILFGSYYFAKWVNKGKNINIFKKWDKDFYDSNTNSRLTTRKIALRNILILIITPIIAVLLFSIFINLIDIDLGISPETWDAGIIGAGQVWLLGFLFNLYKLTVGDYFKNKSASKKEYSKAKEIIKKPPAQNHSKYEPKTKKQNISLDNSNELFQTFKNKDHSNYMPNQPNKEIIPKRLNFKDFKSVGFVNFYNGLPYTGTGFELNKEGNIKTEFNLVNGIKEGKAIEFYDNGSVKIESFYTNNKVNGLSTTFFKNGKVKSKASFDNGKLVDVKSDIELNNETKSNSKISKEDAKNKLLELKEYLDLGIITQDEFDEKAKPLKKILLGN